MEKYNERFREHGDDCKALGWPSERDNHKRFRVMWEIVRTNKDAPFHLLDFGCGLGHFAKWLDDESNLGYVGVDINPEFIMACRSKYPLSVKSFVCLDVLRDDDFRLLPEFDYIICNGVFTEKLDTPWQTQWDYFTTIVKRLWSRTRHGLAFNLMSPVVDTERDDLFHVPLDDIARFVRFILGTRNFTIRHDYDLWEYTVHVYR